MTCRQEAFARLVVSGIAPSEAYGQAGYRVSQMSARSIAVEAAHLQSHSAVSARIDELRNQADQSAVLTMQRRRRILCDIAESDGSSGAERVAAIREDAVLAGERRTDGTQVTVNGDVNLALVLQSLHVRAPDVTKAVEGATDTDVSPETAKPVQPRGCTIPGPLD